jgi:hypothetical protein
MKTKPKRKSLQEKKTVSDRSLNYPRHDLERALRVPQAIMDQNAGKECTEKESASFLGIKYAIGPYTSEISSSIKFGLLSRPTAGHLALTDISRKILRPQNQNDEITGLRATLPLCSIA